MAIAVTQDNVERDIKEKFQAFLDKGEPPYNYEKGLVSERLDRVTAILNNENPPPYELEIQPTSICDLKCKHCFGRKFKRLPDKIGKEELDRLSEDIINFEKDSKFKFETIKFCGSTGEPLLSPYTAYGIELFFDLGKYVRLFTNGMHLQDEGVLGKSNLESLLRVNALNLSLDAGSDETIKRLKGANADYNQIMEGLRGLVELKERNNLKRPHITVSYVIGESNYEGMEQATKDVKEAGADLIRFKIDLTAKDVIVNLADEILEHAKKARGYDDGRFKVRVIHSTNEIHGKKPQIFGEKNSLIKCYTSTLWACVGSDFKLYPCGHACHGDSSAFGDLYDSPFEEIWKNPRTEKIRSSLPGKGCYFCSPFGTRTNEFMNFLVQINEQGVDIKNYVKSI